MIRSVNSEWYGSPPRAWGQCRAGVHANNGALVHPHGRGDNHPIQIALNRHHGSPPRAWGQCDVICPTHRARRFTPTGVGTMRRLCAGARAAAVHPHGRGDNCAYAALKARVILVHPHGRGDNARQGYDVTGEIGSPPRAWGQFAVEDDQKDFRRFTPTGVGTICGNWSAASATPVHPHGRGDNRGRQKILQVERGSPPRAWGQCTQ